MRGQVDDEPRVDEAADERRRFHRLGAPGGCADRRRGPDLGGDRQASVGSLRGLRGSSPPIAQNLDRSGVAGSGAPAPRRSPSRRSPSWTSGTGRATPLPRSIRSCRRRPSSRRPRTGRDSRSPATTGSTWRGSTERRAPGRGHPRRGRAELVARRPEHARVQQTADRCLVGERMRTGAVTTVVERDWRDPSPELQPGRPDDPVHERWRGADPSCGPCPRPVDRQTLLLRLMAKHNTRGLRHVRPGRHDRLSPDGYDGVDLTQMTDGCGAGSSIAKDATGGRCTSEGVGSVRSDPDALWPMSVSRRILDRVRGAVRTGVSVSGYHDRRPSIGSATARGRPG